MSSLPDIVVHSPVDGRVVGTLAAHNTDDVVAAFARARRAQAEWAAVPVRKRAKIGKRMHDYVLDNQSRLMDIIQAETGKNRAGAFEEVLDVAVTARHYGFTAEKLLRPKRVRGPLPIIHKTVVQRAPVGVVGFIAPWNYPLSFAVADVIPALIAGNGVILKPDSRTPHTALSAAELLLKAGIPDGLLHVLPGHGIEVGQAIAENCDYLMFTGSTSTGRVLGAKAGERLVGYTAELSGKNPMIVLPGCNMERAIRGARRAAFSSAGQMCISSERILVHKDIYDEFKTRFVADVKSMAVGAGSSWEIDMGCLYAPEQVERMDKIVTDAVDKGAVLLTGGHALPNLGPSFYAPTVLEGITDQMILGSEEVFGPVVYLEQIDSIDDAIEKANNTDYGLNVSIFGPRAQAWKLAQHMHAGTVGINDGYAAAWGSVHAPMGGWKISGIGRRHGDTGLTSFTEERTVAEQRFISSFSQKPEDWTGNTFADTMTKGLKLAKHFLR
ncbi:succinic semialdehyde dehydrogenase [Corynebacterium mendelii]|uniref:Aldehyde dehydrogenase family protein n=2 Tax=Corynebacterium mendelii TaxID=2765362 RepID=A0A939E274_9CORY|nr:succinic semialdehyde dehydrogenase [Corynebacterium mendelii]MBN9644326.1 aldehyde dehydrogenase family protein [Corynebacterium mendelii]